MSIDMPEIKRLFMLFHGMYGNQLLDKFRTGDLNENGEDRGILSAQAVWLNGLREFSFETLKLAVGRTADKHKTFPPTLPEFRDICRAVAPKVAVQRDPAPALGMSDEMRAKVREANRQALAEAKMKRMESNQFGTGLPALMLMVAKSIGDAGGDEVKALLALEAQFKPRNTA
jgi:hypothetical protein